MNHCRELIHDEALQEEQIVAADKVIRLLFPPERTITNLERPDLGFTLPNCTPSMLAASTILGFVKS